LPGHDQVQQAERPRAFELLRRIRRGDRASVNAMLREDPDAALRRGIGGYTMLMRAAEAGNPDMAGDMIEAAKTVIPTQEFPDIKTYVNARTADGLSALNFAVKGIYSESDPFLKGFFSDVETLLKRNGAKGSQVLHDMHSRAKLCTVQCRAQLRGR